MHAHIHIYIYITIYRHLYEKKVKKSGLIVTELSKYSILQMRHVFNLSSDHFLQASFIWFDFL